MTDTVELKLGPGEWQIHVPRAKLVMPSVKGTSSTGSVDDMIRDALEKPHGFEPLRRATTPDDKVTIVVDDRLPHLPVLLTGILTHLQSAGIGPAAVTLLLAPPARNQGFIDDLPDELSDVTVEVHDPANDKRIAYLSTTQAGRRVYLNRTLVESDFVIVLSGRRFDPVVGIDGGSRAIFPTLSNMETQSDFAGRMPVRDPLADIDPKPEADEIAWLLGTPFFVQVIEGADGEIDSIVAGLIDSLAEGITRQRARWEISIPRRSSLVIATAKGELNSIANAMANAGRVLDGIGHMVVLAEPSAVSDDAFLVVRNAKNPAEAATVLQAEKPDGLAGAMLWTLASRLGTIHLGPGWDNAKELFAKPIDQGGLQSLIDTAESVTVLTDAHLSFVRVSA